MEHSNKNIFSLLAIFFSVTLAGLAFAEGGPSSECTKNASGLFNTKASVAQVYRTRRTFDAFNFERTIRQLTEANVRSIDFSSSATNMLTVVALSENLGRLIEASRQGIARYQERLRILESVVPTEKPVKVFLPRPPSIQREGSAFNGHKTVTMMGDSRYEVEFKTHDELKKFIAAERRDLETIQKEIEPWAHRRQAALFIGLEPLIDKMHPDDIDALMLWANLNRKYIDELEPENLFQKPSPADGLNIVMAISARAAWVLRNPNYQPSTEARLEIASALGVRQWELLYDVTMPVYRSAVWTWSVIYDFADWSRKLIAKVSMPYAVGVSTFGMAVIGWREVVAYKEALDAEAYERNTSPEQKKWDKWIKEIKQLKLDIADKSRTFDDFYSRLDDYFLATGSDPGTKIGLDFILGRRERLPVEGESEFSYMPGIARMFQIHDALMFGFYDPETGVMITRGAIERLEIREANHEDFKELARRANLDQVMRLGVPAGVTPYIPPKPAPRPPLQ